MKNYKLQITVTKEILKRSMMCGQNGESWETNCAVSLAIRDILPIAQASYNGNEAYIYPFERLKNKIELPSWVGNYMKLFDDFHMLHTPEKRLELPEITFEVEIPDEVIDKIDISKIYEGHPTLQLFESIDN